MLRLNVVCTDRDQRFMVLGKEDDTLDTLRYQTQTIFEELYPHELPINIGGFQNEFHFDIPLQYKIRDALIDTGLVFAIEAEPDHITYALNNDSGVSSFCDHNVNKEETTEKEPEQVKKVIHDKRKTDSSGLKQKSHKKKKAALSRSDESYSLVSSTGSPAPKARGSPLLPQRVESGDEDNEVDIESVQEENLKMSENKDKTLKQKPTAKAANFVTSTPLLHENKGSTSFKRDKKSNRRRKKKYGTLS